MHPARLFRPAFQGSTLPAVSSYTLSGLLSQRAFFAGVSAVQSYSPSATHPASMPRYRCSNCCVL